MAGSGRLIEVPHLYLKLESRCFFSVVFKLWQCTHHGKQWPLAPGPGEPPSCSGPLSPELPKGLSLTLLRLLRWAKLTGSLQSVPRSCWGDIG